MFVKLMVVQGEVTVAVYPGEMIQFDVHIFQLGCFNQQLLVDSFLDACRSPFLLEFFPVTA